MHLREKLVEIEWKFAQLAVIVAGTNGENAFADSGFDSRTHGSNHRRFIHAIDYGFVSALIVGDMCVGGSEPLRSKEWLIAVDRLRLEKPPTAFI